MPNGGLLKRSRVYFIVPPGVYSAAIEAMSELESRGFVIHSTWHRPLVKSRLLQSEIVHMMMADAVIVWPSGLGAEDWVKIGAAYAAGLRIIALGSLSAFPDDLRKFFMIHFEGGFGELLENPITNVVSSEGLWYKKPKIEATEGDLRAEEHRNNPKRKLRKR